MMFRNKSRESGIAAVEFAIVLPIVLVVLFGIFEFGFAFWRKQSLTAAVREGARKAIVKTTEVKNEGWVRTKVETYMDGVGLTDPARTVSCTGCPCASADDPITVTATYPTNFAVLHNFVGTDSSKTMTAQVVMRCE